MIETYKVRVHVPAQDLEVEVLALNESQAVRVVSERFDNVEHWIQGGVTA